MPVSELINGSGITAGQQQGGTGGIGAIGGSGGSGASGGNVQQHQEHEEIDLHTPSTQPPIDRDDENTQPQPDDHNTQQRTTPTQKGKHVAVKCRKYPTRGSSQALKSKFPPTSAADPLNID
ncbi:PREDICTED: uncharacterized protein LOC109153444 [Ipomoea nil]|uniref:uncharacterized protein LOC109153444 n=1 Tax=Ipomoea nil TaxID=35883 RepID=UPI000900D310|nr:PREDICTED: uncharacterized protein LOC109153444 [Ipomoea nil]